MKRDYSLANKEKEKKISWNLCGKNTMSMCWDVNTREEKHVINPGKRSGRALLLYSKKNCKFLQRMMVSKKLRKNSYPKNELV